MRLAIINHHGRKASGAEHSLLVFLSMLPDDVEPVFYLFEDGEFAQELQAKFKNVTILHMTERVANATRSALPLDAVGDSLGLVWRLARELRRSKVDLVLTNTMKAHVIGGIAARIAGKRCINYVHDVLDGNALRLAREVSRFCASERLVCSRVVVQNLGLSDTTVVYSPIDTAKFRDLPAPAEARRQLGLPIDDLPVVGMVGRIAPWKGQDRFIRIAAAVRERGADAHFAIIGSPIFACKQSFVDALHELVQANGLQTRMHFVPWQTDLRTAYAALDVACNCSTREPFGRTTVEALACGVPVVCFDDAGVCEIFEGGGGGITIRAGDEDAFADSVAHYINNPATRSSAGAPARVAASTVDSSRIAQHFIDAISRNAPQRVKFSGLTRRVAPLPESPL